MYLREVRFRYLLLTVLLLVNSGIALTLPFKAPKLEGMAYDKARAVILRYGWKPFPRGCGWPEKSVCTRYPELTACQGISPGYCGMTFVKDERCLFVTTLESPPGGDDTWIVQVTFRHGPCPKNG